LLVLRHPLKFTAWKISTSRMEVLRRLSPARKLAVMTGLIRQAYRLKTAWLRMTEPELSEEEIAEKVREAVAGGGA
jgi:hypothetical protein